MRYEKIISSEDLLVIYPLFESILSDKQKNDYLSWFNLAEICKYNSHSRYPLYNIMKPKDNMIIWTIGIRGYIGDKELPPKDQKYIFTYIGNIGLGNIDHINQSAEISIMIGDKDYHGKGIGKEVFKMVITHAFNELNLNRIWFGCDERNEAMKKIGDSLNFFLEGIQKKAFFKAGSFRNILNYALLREDYKQDE